METGSVSDLARVKAVASGGRGGWLGFWGWAPVLESASASESVWALGGLALEWAWVSECPELNRAQDCRSRA